MESLQIAIKKYQAFAQISFQIKGTHKDFQRKRLYREMVEMLSQALISNNLIYDGQVEDFEGQSTRYCLYVRCGEKPGFQL